MALCRTGWYGLKNLLFKLFGYEHFQASISQSSVLVYGRKLTEVSFLSFQTIEIQDELFGLSTLTISDRTIGKIELVGFAKKEATKFAMLTRKSHRQTLRAIFNLHRANIISASNELTKLQFYPAASICDPLLDQVRGFSGIFSLQFPAGLLAPVEVQHVQLVKKFWMNPNEFRRVLISKFVSAELLRSQKLLDTVEKNPLTPEQRNAVVTDEDATLVLASAGSGKTSVIVAKAAHLVTRDRCKPHQIMMMSFGDKASKEITARLKQRTQIPIKGRTFHSIGKEIITKSEGRARRLAPHAYKRKELQLLIKSIVEDLIYSNKNFALLLKTWFSDFRVAYKSLWDFETLSEYLHYIRSNELRSLKGDEVRSFEECEIANWLYMNGVQYEYEKPYEHKVSSPGRREYKPDFFLSKSRAYIEHFGISRHRTTNGEYEYQTAPYIDCKKYLSDRKWKLNVHKKHGTKLIQTFSYEKSEGRLIDSLKAQVLAAGETLQPISTEEMLENLRAKGSIDSFTELLCAFLSQFKGNNLKFEDLLPKVKDKNQIPRNRAFIEIFASVYRSYSATLGELIDFDDMISLATKYVEEGRYQSPFRYLLVDEFQDISRGRVLLLKALLASNKGSKLFAVGDDWQSIFRFAGSDVSVMRNFGDVFGRSFNQQPDVHEIVDLGRTFRCVDKVALPATYFVTRNSSQLPKTVEPAGKTEAAAIRVNYSSNKSADHFILKQTLKKLNDEAKQNSHTSSVTILARFGYNKPDVEKLRIDFPSISIQTYTVHGSKGLEADHIIVLGMNSGRLGFPCEIVDDPVLDMVLPSGEDFPHAEERRLFYVALTRARRTVDLIASTDTASSFVQELVENDNYDIEIVGDRPSAPGKCIRCGGRVLRLVTSKGKIKYECENKPYCVYTAPACPHCEADTPARHSDYPDKVICSCEARFPICSKCGDGWRTVRKGPYSEFLGCSNYPLCDNTGPK